MEKELLDVPSVQTTQLSDKEIKYQLAVLNRAGSDNTTFLTISQMIDNDLIPINEKTIRRAGKPDEVRKGIQKNSGPNGSLYIMMENPQGRALQAVYLNKTLQATTKEGDDVTSEKHQFMYVIPKTGDLDADGVQREPFFVAVPVGSDETSKSVVAAK